MTRIESVKHREEVRRGLREIAARRQIERRDDTVWRRSESEEGLSLTRIDGAESQTRAGRVVAPQHARSDDAGGRIGRP